MVGGHSSFGDLATSRKAIGMYIILAYDIGQKRVQKVMRICRKYLHHIQNSVFEGTITEAALERLKHELQNKIYKEADSIIIFRFESLKYTAREEIGAVRIFENIID